MSALDFVIYLLTRIKLRHFRLSTSPESQAELGKAHHDPWSVDFADTFNNPLFLTNSPDPVDGVTKDLIEQFDPWDMLRGRNPQG
jgi:hypothetical protein